MRAFVLGLLLFSSLFLRCELSEDTLLGVDEEGLADLPPRGWNSYDSFSWIISEDAFLQNAEIIAKSLLPHGYEYVVVDFLWYRKNVDGAWLDSYGYDSIDEWGRVIPDPDRWPSSRGGKGFKEVAQKVHDMGLKFGIHLMRGISTEAFNSNTPILDIVKGGVYEEAGGQTWGARDIGIKEMTCAWMKHGFMSVNTDTGAGRAFLRSLYRQYAEWGVDLVKLDCVFGDDLDSKEIMTVSELLEEIERPIVYSLSPGTSVTPSMAEGISNHVNMYRITGDDWDTWGDVEAHFNVSRDFAAAKYIGAKGLHGRSWPDLDMLPLGWLTDPGVRHGPYRKCSLTFHEQRTQMTLWCMAKSPLMFGGDLRHIDDITFSIITNPTLLEINSYSTNNTEFPHVFTRDLRSRSSALTKRFISLEDVNIPDSKVLGLTSCKDEKAKGWVIKAHDEDLDHICWNDYTESNDEIPFCLYKRRPLLTSDKEIIFKEKYQGKFHLLATKTRDICLGASVNHKLTSSEIKSTSLSPCNWKANQMWGLNDNGTLMSSYSGLCAKPKEAKLNTGGIRSWIATGRGGEIYLSFFNMNPDKTQIYARLSDLGKVLQNRFLVEGTCNCTEVWSEKDFGMVKQTLSTTVEEHGCALFVLNCNKS